MRWRSFNLLQLIMHYSEALENELKIESRAAHLLLFAEVLLVLSHLIMSFVSKHLDRVSSASLLSQLLLHCCYFVPK